MLRCRHTEVGRGDIYRIEAVAELSTIARSKSADVGKFSSRGWSFLQASMKNIDDGRRNWR